MSIIVDSEIDSGIKKIIAPIVKASGINVKELTIYIIPDPTINAFVADGKSVFLYTGLITLFNDPDVLKGVVAHELGHIHGGHIFKNVAKSKEVASQTMWASLFGIAAGVVGNSPDLIIGSLSGSAHTANRRMTSYSRLHESAADKYAVTFLHQTNNSVRGLIKLQEYFSAQQLHFNPINKYAITHPLSNERLEVVKLAYEQENKAFKSTEEEKRIYSRIVAKLSGFLDPIGSKKYDYNLDSFSKTYQEALFAYRQNKYETAFLKLDELIKSEPNNPYMYQVKGEFLYGQGKIEEAVQNYRIASELGSNDIILKGEYGLALLATLDSIKNKEKKEEVLNEVIELLEAVNLSNFKSSYIYRNLAIAYGKLGDLGHSNLMLAEEALMKNRKEAALSFINKAQKHAKNNEKLKLKIDDFIKTLPNKN